MSEPTRQTVEVYPQRAGKTSRQREHLRSRPERWRVDVAALGTMWMPHALFNSREAAEAYAEALVKRADQRNLMARVVDMNPPDPVTVAIFEEDNVGAIQKRRPPQLEGDK